jgi:hypothetical protein
MKACILCLVTALKNWSYEHLCRVKSIFIINRAVFFGHSPLSRIAVAVIPVGVVRLPPPPGARHRDASRQHARHDRVSPLRRHLIAR